MNAAAPEAGQQDRASDEEPRHQFGLSPKVPLLRFCQGLMTAAFISVPLGMSALRKGSWSLGAASLLLMVLLPVLRGLHGRLYVRSFRCALNDGLLVARGVWWRREIFVPAARIQHTDIRQGPLARRFGLATLKVFTAGTAAGRIVVSDLTEGDVRELRDRLLGRHGSSH